MKKFSSLLTTLMIATTAIMTLTSCDDDSKKAFVLDGTWTGTIGTYYADRWGINGKSLHTAMKFDMTDPWGGDGYEVDFDTNSPYSHFYFSEFTWRISDGVIIIKYKDNWDEVRIYDYDLEIGGWFKGYIDDGKTKDIYFKLHYDNKFDWTPYGISSKAPSAKEQPQK